MKQPSWRDVLPIHPAAELFPLPAPDELKALGEDIVKNKLTASVVLWRAHPNAQAQLLDGRSRLDALEIVIGKPVEVGPPSIACGDFLACNKVIVLDKSVDPFAYVVSANVHRRHLNYEQRVEALAKIIACSPEKSDRQIAKELGVDHKTIGRARAKGEDVGSIPHVATRTDARGRKQPVKKRQTERSKQRAEADRQRTGVTGKSELARLRARNEEIERENRRLEGENLALRSQVEELRAELAKRAPSAAPPADDGLDIPAFLQRSGP